MYHSAAENGLYRPVGAIEEARPPLSRNAGVRRISLYACVIGLVLADFLAIVFLGGAVGAALEGFRSAPALDNLHLEVIIFGAFSQFVWARLFNLYRTRSILNQSRAFQRAPLCCAAAFALLLVIAAATKSAETYSRLWFFSWAGASILIVVIIRLAFFKLVSNALAQGGCVRRALSVGLFCKPLPPEHIERQTRKEARVIESIELRGADEIETLSAWITRDEIDEIYLATRWEDIPLVLGRLHLLRHLSTRVFVLPSDRMEGMLAPKALFFGGRPMFCAIEEPIRGWGLVLKRVEDVLIAGGALLVLAPLLAIVALAIKLESPGPIFFRQRRVGFNGQTFEILKFRSMYVDRTDHNATVQTSRKDPRVTRAGRFIRRTSIDELPQLLNVLRGAMSIVGPRPHALATKAEGRALEDVVDFYAVRHRVKPGLTGWAQIHGLRGELDSVEKLRKRVDYDIEYIDNWTLWRDLEIIVRTVLLILHDKKAY